MYPLWQIEETHPLRKVRNQAANLRFILQAPKLKRGPDEMIQLPILDVEERKKCAAETLGALPSVLAGFSRCSSHAAHTTTVSPNYF